MKKAKTPAQSSKPFDHNVVRGTVDLLILKALSWGARHGYGISEWIEEATGKALPMEEGTLYPALHRLANKGWIAAEWGVSENKRRAKFYQLTPQGRARLSSETAAWQRYVEAAGKALGALTAEETG